MIKKSSALEEALAMQLKAAGIKHYREYAFAPPRKWRVDFLLPKMWCVEVEGAVWVQGRHTRGSGFIKDMEKYNALAEKGYHLLRYSMAEIKSGAALAQIERMLA